MASGRGHGERGGDAGAEGASTLSSRREYRQYLLDRWIELHPEVKVVKLELDPNRGVTGLTANFVIIDDSAARQ